MRRAVLYLRVSTIDQTTANQERELREIAGRMGCKIVKVYKDHGISGAKGREKRPAFDALCRDANRRQFDVVMAWYLLIASAEAYRTLSASYPSCTPSRSTCSFINSVSTPPLPAARPCFKCSAFLPSSSGASSKNVSVLA